MIERVLAGALVVPFLLGMAAAPSGEGRVVFEFGDPEIVESSGLVVADGLFLTTNDSGDSGRVFVVDPETGRTVGVTRWSDHPVDVESLAPAGNGEVWVGDTGDNTAARDSISLTRVPVGRSDLSIEPESYRLVYPDGPQDAETLLRDPGSGRLYVVSKNVFGGTIYRAPRSLSAERANRLVALGGVAPIATDGAFFPDGKHFVLRDYSRAIIYSFPGLEEVGSFGLPDQQQGEGIAVDVDGNVFVSTEGQFSEVLGVPVPAAIRSELAAVPTAAASSQAPGSGSREDPEQPGSPGKGPVWPWFLTGGIGLAAIVVLRRSLSRR